MIKIHNTHHYMSLCVCVWASLFRIFGHIMLYGTKIKKNWPLEIVMCSQTSSSGSETQSFPKTRQKTEFWTIFKSLTRARQDGSRFKSQAVKVCFISTAKGSCNQESQTISGTHRDRQGWDGLNFCIFIFTISFHMMKVFSKNIWCDLLFSISLVKITFFLFFCRVRRTPLFCWQFLRQNLFSILPSRNSVTQTYCPVFQVEDCPVYLFMLWQGDLQKCYGNSEDLQGSLTKPTLGTLVKKQLAKLGNRFEYH